MRQRGNEKASDLFSRLGGGVRWMVVVQELGTPCRNTRTGPLLTSVRRGL